VKWLPQDDADIGGTFGVETPSFQGGVKQTTLVATSELKEMRLRLAQLERREQERHKDEQRKGKEHLAAQIGSGTSGETPPDTMGAAGSNNDVGLGGFTNALGMIGDSSDTRPGDRSLLGEGKCDGTRGGVDMPDSPATIGRNRRIGIDGDNPHIEADEREEKCADLQFEAQQRVATESAHVQINRATLNPGQSHRGIETKSADAEAANPPRALAAAARNANQGDEAKNSEAGSTGTRLSEKDTPDKRRESAHDVEKNRPKLPLPADPAMWGVADVSTWIRGQCTTDAEVKTIGTAFADAEARCARRTRVLLYSSAMFALVHSH